MTYYFKATNNNDEHNKSNKVKTCQQHHCLCSEFWPNAEETAVVSTARKAPVAWSWQAVTCLWSRVFMAIFRFVNDLNSMHLALTQIKWMNFRNIPIHLEYFCMKKKLCIKNVYITNKNKLYNVHCVTMLTFCLPNTVLKNKRFFKLYLIIDYNKK